MVDIGARMILLLACPIAKFVGMKETASDIRVDISAKPEIYDDLVGSNMARMVGWVILTISCIPLAFFPPLLEWLGYDFVAKIFSFVLGYSFMTFISIGLWNTIRICIGWGCRYRELAGDHSLRRRLSTPGNVDIIVPAIIVLWGFIASSS